MDAIKVIFENSEYNYVTSVNPQATKEGLMLYFIGTAFNMGAFPVEDFQTCIDIEIL